MITTPKTPYPWINYLGIESFFGLISHQGGGYCFYRDARLRRLTRYRYNNVPDRRGRSLLLRRAKADDVLDARLHAGQDASSTRSSAVTASATRASPARETGFGRAAVLRAARATTREVHQVTLDERELDQKRSSSSSRSSSSACGTRRTT